MTQTIKFEELIGKDLVKNPKCNVCGRESSHAMLRGKYATILCVICLQKAKASINKIQEVI